MTERKRVTLLIGATALSVVLVALASRLPAPAPLVAGIGVLPLALLLMLWRRCAPRRQTAGGETAIPAPPPRPIPAEPVRDWLLATLAELADATIVCDLVTHRIAAANAAAATLFGRTALTIGSEITLLLPSEPLLRALDGLAPGGSAALVCADADGTRLLRGKIRVHAGFYLLSLVAEEAEPSGALRDLALRRAAIRDLRRPLANLRAAAETIAAFPHMTPPERAAFDEVIAEECTTLSAAVERLESHVTAHLPAAANSDLHSQDLFNCLARSLAGERITLNMVGIPLWLHGDSRALLDSFTALVRHLVHGSGQREFDFEALLADRRVYVDLAWNGPAIPAAMVDLWLDQPAGAGGDSLRDLLDRHESEPWSQKGSNPLAVLRIPLPPPTRPQFAATDRPRQPRPEVHDLGLMQRHLNAGAQANDKLSTLPFIAFDCETTGLRPDQGDRLVQIGAVRIAQGRVLSGESFERLIDPGCPIPPQSRLYHGIDDDMVKGKPPLRVVLPQFASFAANAVLVGHNVAFDLKFMDAAQGEAGIALRQPVLDTMILAALLDPGYDLSLAAVAERLGIPPLPHRSALSDALITAEILARLLPRLEAKGLHTLGQACQASLDWLGQGQRP
ncbi:3'-5' exonuclease [Magnetospirillum sulfuroxidans]|uniref:DNA-directed DNA polymerase n=1 Tax=Magnetospirillum sulfuroxidans TaxID=611300 RepID=A0ABS5IHG2_9PROT|nr:3'-5' exonuclease [Magnetospirillum sulfuroxidans]MBR9973866.1 3'-5' exonuclease [Magnetospirillum sulfuroxidans]